MSKMWSYIKRNILKLKEELIAKSLYDFAKTALVISWGALVASPFYHNFSFFDFINRRVNINIIQMISVVLVSMSLSSAAAYFYYRKRFILVAKDLRTDELTLLPNSRALIDDLPALIASARKEGTSMCVIMMDIDDFKNFNSTYNQSIADDVLIKFGSVVKSDNRGTDAIYRQHVKGDEFVIIAKDTSLENALKAADRRREFIAKASIRVLGVSAPIQLTVCCGVVELQSSDTQKTLLDRAFDAMKLAKAKPGKNNTELLVS